MKVVVLVALVAGACGGDDAGDGSGGGLGALATRASTTTVVESQDPTPSTIAKVPPSTTTTTAPALDGITAATFEDAFLNSSDVPGFTGPMTSAQELYITEPPACGEAIGLKPDMDLVVNEVRTFSSPETWFHFSHDIIVLRSGANDADEVRAGLAGPCAEGFTSDWDGNVLEARYTLLDDTALDFGDEAMAARMDGSVIVEGQLVNITSIVLAVTDGPVTWNLSVITGGAADGSWASPEANLDDLVRLGGVLDQRMSDVLEREGLS